MRSSFSQQANKSFMLRKALKTSPSAAGFAGKTEVLEMAAGHRGKCTRRYAPNVERKLGFLLNRWLTVQFTVKTALPNKKLSRFLARE